MGTKGDSFDVQSLDAIDFDAYDESELENGNETATFYSRVVQHAISNLEETRHRDLLSVLPLSTPLSGKIVDMVEVDSRSMFHRFLYTIELTFGSFQWQVQRYNSDFIALHNKLSFLRYRNSVVKKSSLPVTPIQQVGSQRNGPRVKLSLRPDILLRTAEEIDEKKVKLEAYINQVFSNTSARCTQATLEFVEASFLSFVPELGVKGKEGLVKKRSGGYFRKGFIFGFQPFRTWRRRSTCQHRVIYTAAVDWVIDQEFYLMCLLPHCCTHLHRWLVLKESSLCYLDQHNGALNEVLLIDSSLTVKPLPVKKRGMNKSFPILISNNTRYSLTSGCHCRDLEIRLKNARSAGNWENAINAMTLTSRYTTAFNKYDSFANPRLNSSARWFVDGDQYFLAVAEALEHAKEEIFITDWWLSPEVYMKRPIIRGHFYRLDSILKRKAESGVKVYVLIYKDFSMAMLLDSVHTKRCLSSLHPNIKVMRHPARAKNGVFFWTHHEKLVIIDQNIAFFGGLDLCFGRWDDFHHRLTDIGFLGAAGLDQPDSRSVWCKTMKDKKFLDKVVTPGEPPATVIPAEDGEQTIVFFDDSQIVQEMHEASELRRHISDGLRHGRMPRLKTRRSSSQEDLAPRCQTDRPLLRRQQSDDPSAQSRSKSVFAALLRPRGNETSDRDTIRPKHSLNDHGSRPNEDFRDHKTDDTGMLLIPTEYYEPSGQRSPRRDTVEMESHVPVMPRQRKHNMFSRTRKLTTVRESRDEESMLQGTSISDNKVVKPCQSHLSSRQDVVDHSTPQSSPTRQRFASEASSSSSIDYLPRPILERSVSAPASKDDFDSNHTHDDFPKPSRNFKPLNIKKHAPHRSNENEPNAPNAASTELSDTCSSLGSPSVHRSSIEDSLSHAPVKKKTRWSKLRSAIHATNRFKHSEKYRSKRKSSSWKHQLIRRISAPADSRHNVQGKKLEDVMSDHSASKLKRLVRRISVKEQPTDSYHDLFLTNLKPAQLDKIRLGAPFFPDQPKPEVEQLKEVSKLWVGKDYANFVVGGLFDMDKPFSDLLDRHVIPRMPWHDIAAAVYGAPALDFARHFIQRWNFTKREIAKHKRKYPMLVPKSFTALPPVDISMLTKTSPCTVQVLRSVHSWSAGLKTNKTERSIYNAYIDLIENAEHYIYIENQFFISFHEDPTVENRINVALVKRILKAHSESARFRVYFVIPYTPLPEELIPYCYRSICYGNDSILGCLQKNGIANPDRYVSFCSLRTWAELKGQLVTEMVYVHSKLMIVDDKYTIIGSANINDRSLLGSRDSEVAALITDTSFTTTVMNGKPYESGLFALKLRYSVMSEHLGYRGDINRNTDAVDIIDPVADEFYWNRWRSLAKKNSQVYDDLFNIIPSNKLRSAADISAARKTKNHPYQGDYNNSKLRLQTEVCGFLVEFPQHFLSDVDITAYTGFKQMFIPGVLYT